MNLIFKLENIISKLKENDVKFTKNGYPIFKKNWLAESAPLEIIPFNKKQYSKEKSNTSICFFCNDSDLYPRFNKIENEISILKQYHSVCMMDVSISVFMDDEIQMFHLLLNLVYSAFLAMNGIKIIPSFRSGNEETVSILKECIPDAKMWVLGALGTQRIKNNLYLKVLFCQKCFYLLPKTILIYGTPNRSTLSIFQIINTSIITYLDFKQRCFQNRGVNYGRL